MLPSVMYDQSGDSTYGNFEYSAVREGAQALPSTLGATTMPYAATTNEKALYVDNVPAQCNEDDIKRLFSSFGSVLAVNLSHNSRLQQGAAIARVDGYVIMASHKDANLCIMRLHGSTALGGTTPLRVTWANGSHNTIVSPAVTELQTPPIVQHMVPSDLTSKPQHYRSGSSSARSPAVAYFRFESDDVCIYSICMHDADLMC